jgi:hypothetical protein
MLDHDVSILQESSQPFTISGTLDNFASHMITKLGTGTLVLSGAQTHGPGAILTVSAGTANINSDSGSNSIRNLTLNANSATNFGSTQHLAALNIGLGATAMLTADGTKNLVTNALAIAGASTVTGKLDLTNNAAVVDYPVAGPNPSATVRSQIIAGRGGSGLGKPWNGNGITSSTVQADVTTSPNSTSLGYAVNGEMPLGALAAFRGQPVDATSVLIRYTRSGDANLDGVVDNNDVTIVGANYAPGVSKPAWALGDFDYNGFVDNDDVTLLGVFYNPAATPRPSPGTDLMNGSVAPVPEPATAMLVVVAFSILAAAQSRLRRVI